MTSEKKVEDDVKKPPRKFAYVLIARVWPLQGQKEKKLLRHEWRFNFRDFLIICTQL